MKHLYFFKKRVCSFATLLVILAFCCGSLHAADITHNINLGSLTIPGSSADNYIITGSTTTNHVVIQSGYKGTVTLKDVTISLASGTNSPFLVIGQDNCSNYTPVTNVNIVLEGDNKLIFNGTVAAALQVNQGAQINISAITPTDNASGKLTAKATSATPGNAPIGSGGAAIGAPNSSAPQGWSELYYKDGIQYKGINTTKSPTDDTYKTAGGNIIINSGTIKAYGAHGAGIGGGYQTWYNGIIIVTGGVVEARAGRHAAGLGSGCPLGYGLEDPFADKSAIIALPPCEIEAYGSYIGNQLPDLGLAGTKYLTYVNDPKKPTVTIHTEDYEKNAAIYLDLTETDGLKNVFKKVHPDFDLTHVWIGKTGAIDGLMKVHGYFQNITTFFTDASSSVPATLGRPYMPVVATTPEKVDTTIILPLFEAEISFTDYPSMPLIEGYSAAEAKKSAFCIKVKYEDDLDLTLLTYELQKEKEGGTSDFKNLIFLGPDSSTVIPTPTTLRKGDVFYIIAPLDNGKIIGGYTDVILIKGKYDNDMMAGYLRRISAQVVVRDDTGKNEHIKVTADPTSFLELFQTNKTVKLTLKIDHKGLHPIYDPTTVNAKYIITTEPNYDAALAATPLNQWANMAIPSADGVNAVTTVSFAGKAVGTYYIHWYVVSGYFMAHSKDVTDPADQYGGFGKYEIINGKGVTYDGNTNTGGVVPVDTTKYPAGDSVAVRGNTGLLTKTDATFIGWSFGASAVVTTPADEPADLMNANNKFKIVTDTTLYAVWAIDEKGPGGGSDSIPDYMQFAVTYNGNGHTSGTAPTDANLYSTGDSATAKAHGNLVKTGGLTPIVFAGWTPAPVSNVLTVLSAADTTAAFVRAGGVFTITGNTTMYAVWATDANGNDIPDIFETGYNVTYDGNSATSGTAPSDATTYLTGMSVTVKAHGNLAKDSAVFLGWNPAVTSVITTQADEDALTLMKQPGETFAIAGNTPWHAVWAKDSDGNNIPDYRQAKVTYNKGAISATATNLPKTQIVAKGNTIALSTMKATGRYYKLVGWNIMSVPLINSLTMENIVLKMGTFYALGDSLAITGDMTLYAVWVIDQNNDGKPDYAGSEFNQVGFRRGDANVFSESATGTEAITGTRVWSYGNTVYFQSDKAVRANIYTLNGMLFKQLNVPEGMTSELLKGGIYLVEIEGSRYKVVVK